MQSNDPLHQVWYVVWSSLNLKFGLSFKLHRNVYLHLYCVLTFEPHFIMRGPTRHNEISYKQKQTCEKISFSFEKRKKNLSKILNPKFVTLSIHPQHISTVWLQAFHFLFWVCACCGYVVVLCLKLAVNKWLARMWPRIFCLCIISLVHPLINVY